MAGAVGAILLLAIFLTAFGTSVRIDLPRWGAEAERAWGDEVTVALVRLHERLSSGETSTVSGSIPAPPTARALDVPMLGRAAPIPASGSVAFAPACAATNISHLTPGGVKVVDVATGPTGCLDIAIDAAYTPAVRYRLEQGGLLRIDGPDAVVLAGPRVTLTSVSSSLHRVTLAVPSFGGPAGLLVLSSGATLEFALVPSTATAPAAANAASIEVRLSTAYPGAWSAWWTRTIRDAGLEATATAACEPVACTLGPGGSGVVVVRIPGPVASGGDVAFGSALLPTTVRIG